MSQSSIRFLIDEDTPHLIRDGLQRQQPEVDVRVIGGEDAPPLSTKDEEILEFLEREGYILITSDRRTMPVHLETHLQRGGHIPGILLLRRNFSYGQIIDVLELIFAGVPEDFQDQLRHIPF